MPPSASMCLKFDGRKVSLGFKEDSGDIDLLGCEEGEMLQQQKDNHANVITSFDNVINYFSDLDFCAGTEDEAYAINLLEKCIYLVSLTTLNCNNLK